MRRTCDFGRAVAHQVPGLGLADDDRRRGPAGFEFRRAGLQIVGIGRKTP
jgi:hypothetical protein